MSCLKSTLSYIASGLTFRASKKVKPGPGAEKHQQQAEEAPRPPHPRYAPCRVLTSSGVPNVVWFEDALVAHGSDTAVFDLFLLVADPRRAADLLLQHGGYAETRLKIISEDDQRARRGGIRLENFRVANGSRKRDGVVLIDATTWKYSPEDTVAAQSHDSLPPLDKLLTSLMRYWITIPEEEHSRNSFWSHTVANFIYCGYNLAGPSSDRVRSAGFADELPPELRELHFDLIGKYPGKTSIGGFRKHEYHALRYQQIQEGTFTPRPYPIGNVPLSIAEFPELTGFDTVLQQQQPPPRKKKPHKVHKSKAKRQAQQAAPLSPITEKSTP